MHYYQHSKNSPKGWQKDTWPYWNLPNLPAVYALYFDGELKYIGQSRDLRNRFAQGYRSMRYGYARNVHTPWGEFPDTTVIEIKFHHGWRLGDWAMREIRFITRLKPVFNTHHKGRASNV